jgi:RNA polymerase sigma-54 factor
LSLQEHLSGQISVLSLPQKQSDALIYLTQWLSPSGYLEGSAESWARGTVWSPRELEAVVPALQSLDPPGIGARSLRECLLLQLKYQPKTLAFLLVQYYLEALGNCTATSLEAKQNRELLLQKLLQNPQVSLDTNMETLTAALSQIQELEPRPARNFGHINVPIVTPDLKAERQSGGDWRVSQSMRLISAFVLMAKPLSCWRYQTNVQEIPNGWKSYYKKLRTY